jgi:hypothetical protein
LIKCGGASFVQEPPAPAEQAAASVASDTASSDVLRKGDRLDAADEDDAIKPIRPIAITTKLASAAPSETSSSDQGWRRSYAKREAAAGRHRKGKVQRASRHHRAYHAQRSHGKSKQAMVRKKKRTSRG